MAKKKKKVTTKKHKKKPATNKKKVKKHKKKVKKPLKKGQSTTKKRKKTSSATKGSKATRHKKKTPKKKKSPSRPAAKKKRTKEPPHKKKKTVSKKKSAPKKKVTTPAKGTNTNKKNKKQQLQSPSSAKSVQATPKIRKPLEPPPVLRIVLCGPHSVYCLTAQTKVAEGLLKEGLHNDELEYAKTITHPLRRQEFLKSRWLYHKVTKNKAPLVKTKTGIPPWPEHLIGSISHKDGHVGFCFVTTETHYGFGIDIEKISKVNVDLEKKICTPEESLILDRVEALGGISRQEALAVVFSFKEAIFKTYFPLGKIEFGFHDASITEFAYDRHEILARLNKKTSPRSPAGHQVMGFYNFAQLDEDKLVVAVAEERKPFESDLKVQPKPSPTDDGEEDDIDLDDDDTLDLEIDDDI